MEDGDVLHVAPATPRGWLRGPKPLRVTGAPTHFGDVSYVIRPQLDEGVVRVRLDLKVRRRPRQVVVHLRLPDGLRIREAQLNGKPVDGPMPEALLISNPPDRLTLRVNVG